MGKSPAKWIKKVLFGKKTSKSNSLNPAPIMQVSRPVLGTSASTRQNPPVKKDVTANSSSAERVLPLPGISNADNKAPKILSSTNDSVGLSLEEAAVVVQAAVRGYQACRKLQSLRCITRLQAFARGHLVRRQAVATLQSVRGIIKIQALIRGQRVRCSIRKEMPTSEACGELDDQHISSIGNIGSQREVMLLGTAFVDKLLSSLPAALPLQLRYEPEEPNSLWSWLTRWTMLKVCGPHIELKKTSGSVDVSSPAVLRGRAQIVASSEVDNSLKCTVPESERLKVKPKKVTKDPVKSIQEQPHKVAKKIQHNSKNVSKPIVETSVRSVVGSERRKHINGKSTKPDFSEEISKPVEKVIEVTEKAESNPSEVKTSPEVPAEEKNDSRLHNHSNALLQPDEAPVLIKEEVTIQNDIRSKDAQVNDENKKSSMRRASLPAKHDYPENGLHSTPRVPSYMATTESAKAKLRAQASPNFEQDTAEKNALRRHSLPSSNSGKFSSSPRMHRLVQASMKGGIRGDRSLMSSRDSSDSRVLQAEWKR